MASSTQQGYDAATEFATLRFIIESIIARVSTATLVKVVSCTNSGGLAKWGTVNVQPVINQVAGDGQAVPHGQLFKLPYLRVQGGSNAVIIDPEPGDIGIAVFASRDISAMKDQTAIDQVSGGSVRGVPPSSARQFSMSDGLYLGGVLNAIPDQYVRFSSGGVEVVSPTKIRLEAPQVEVVASTSYSVQAGSITEDASGSVSVSGGASVTIDSPDNDISGGNTKIDGKTFLPHTHNGVTPGSGVSGGVT